MKGLYLFQWDCGRMGDLEGIFIADSADVESLIGKNVYFGEVLGKHSEIEGVIENGDITLKTDDPAFIADLEKHLGTGTLSGHNPLDYIERD